MANDTWPTHNLAIATVASMKKWDRKPADLYETPEEATQAALNFLRWDKEGTIAEPACGGGKIARMLERNGYKVEAGDLFNQGYGTPGLDFRTTPVEYAFCRRLMTNPPFKHALEFARLALGEYEFEDVALLLKSNYFHTDNRIALFEMFPPTVELKITWRLPFLKEERGDAPLMDCSWFVWKRGAPRQGFNILRKPSNVPPLTELLSVAIARNLEARRGG